MSLPRYPKYKDSGVEWLGEVPEHWDVRKLKALARLESGHTPSRLHPEYWIEEDCVIPWFTLADVSFLREARNWLITNTSQKISPLGMANSAARLLPPDTVLLSRTASVGFSGVTAIELAVSQDFAAWICGGTLLPRYLLHCLRAMKQDFRRLMMGSTHQTIYMPDIEAFRVPVPPIHEQGSIAEFLTAETAKLDALVAEQERLIELLKEKRQAVISHAVTKGLDPKAPMKDSGIEWLGEVPQHWEVISIKWLSPVRRGASPRPIDDPKYFDDDGACAWVRIADVSSSDGFLRETTQRLSELGRSLSVELAPGDLFVSIAGTVGKPCISAIKACIHDGFVYFPSLEIEPRFLFRIFEAGSCYGGLGKWGTQLNLNTDTIGSIRVAVPPAAEIGCILQSIDASVAEIDLLVVEARQAIDLLQERRAALITAAVTGQIDVRPAAARRSA